MIQIIIKNKLLLHRYLKLIILIFGCITSLISLSQEDNYIITDISEGVFLIKEDTLQIGDHINKTDRITFPEVNSAIEVLNLKKKEFVILSPTIKNVNNKNIIQSILDFYAIKNNIMSRESSRITTTVGLKEYFSKNIFAILNETKIKINIPNTPVNQNSYYLLEYTVNNEPFSKKIKYIDGNLSINKEIFPTDFINNNKHYVFSIVYYNKINKSKTILVHRFFPVIISRMSTYDDIINKKTTIENLHNAKKEDVTNILLEYINTNIGYIDRQNVIDWVNSYNDKKLL